MGHNSHKNNYHVARLKCVCISSFFTILRNFVLFFLPHHMRLQSALINHPWKKQPGIFLQKSWYFIFIHWGNGDRIRLKFTTTLKYNNLGGIPADRVSKNASQPLYFPCLQYSITVDGCDTIRNNNVSSRHDSIYYVFAIINMLQKMHLLLHGGNIE